MRSILCKMTGMRQIWMRRYGLREISAILQFSRTVLDSERTLGD